MPEPLPATCLAAPTEARAPSASAQRDVALVRRVLAAQSAAAHAELLRLYYRPVCRYVRQRVRPADAAEDLTMEIFAKAFRYLASFKQTYAFSTWLFRIATNHCLSFNQKPRLRTVPLHPTGPPDAATPALLAANVPDPAPTPHEALLRAQRVERTR